MFAPNGTSLWARVVGSYCNGGTSCDTCITAPRLLTTDGADPTLSRATAVPFEYFQSVKVRCLAGARRFGIQLAPSIHTSGRALPSLLSIPGCAQGWVRKPQGQVLRELRLSCGNKSETCAPLVEG